MLTFLAAIFFLLITPGPGVLTTAGVGAAFGRSAGLRYVTGLFIGTNLVALAVVTGIAGLMIGIPALKKVLLILSVAYIFYLAARIALNGSRIAFIEAASEPGILNGIALQVINPKAYVVNTTLFTGFNFLAHSPLLEIVYKFILINAIWIPIHILWLYAGISLKALALTERQQRMINWGMAISLIIVVLLAMTGLTA